VRRPSIAAENRGMNEGCEMMMRLARAAGFDNVTRVPTDGQPGTDCPGSTCQSLPASTATTGQLCFNLTGVPLPAPPGSCPAVGHLRRIVRRVGERRKRR
jgi:hypothetical protein